MIPPPGRSPQSQSVRRFDALAVLGLGLLALLFFWPVTFQQGWIPQGGGDLVAFLWPTYSYAAEAVRAGRVPLWNPTLFAGAPFAADNQSGVFYPLNLLAFYLWPGLPYAALEWLVIAHVWLAGAGVYTLLRVLLSSPEAAPAAYAAALVAALAFMFSDVFVTHVGNLNIVAVSAWLPWCFLALHLALARGSSWWAALAGLALGIAALAGHAQMTLIIALALGLYGLAWVLVSGRRALRLGTRRLGLLALLFIVAAGVGALSLLPALEMTRYTGRARLDYASAAEYSLPWAGLAGLFSPLIFGRGASHFWAPWARVEAGYVGAVTLLLAGLAPFRRGRLPLFLLLLAGFGLLVALGANTPVHRLLYTLVPGFAQLRVPARFILLTDFALAVLAGLGLHHLAAGNGRHAARWGGALLALGAGGSLLAFGSVAAGAPHTRELAFGLATFVALVVAGLAIARQPRRPVYLGLLVALVAADLIGHGAWVEVEPNDPTLGFQHSQAVAYLHAQSGPFRIDNAASTWSPDAAARFGLEDIGGLHNPLALAAYTTYLGAVGSRGSPLYNFLNVQFVVSDKGRPPGDFRFVPVFDEDPTVDIYLNTAAQPRLRLVYDTVLVASGEEAFGRLHAPGFDPSTQVVLDSSVHGPVPALAGPPPAGASNLFYLEAAPEAFSIVAQTPGPAYLVLSEVWYPGWRAWLDQREVPIYLANFAFRAVYLPSAGTHTLRMRFEPVTWEFGLALSVFACLALAAWGAVRLHQRARARGIG